MKLKELSLPVSLVFLIGMFFVSSPEAAYSTTAMSVISCETSLDGDHVVPPVDTDGTGSATLELDGSTNELTWTIEYSDLTGPATVAHIHGPAGTNSTAGVQVNLGNFSAGIESPIEGSADLTEEQVSMLLDGQLYINIHTEAHPADEIRGQIACESGAGSEGMVAVLGFDVKYEISGGTLDSLTAAPETYTLTAAVSTESAGNLTLWLPTELIDAEDDYATFIDGEFGNFVVDELAPTQDSRVLRISFPSGAEAIEIVGTSMADSGPAPGDQEKVSVAIEGKTYDIPYKVTGGSVQSVSADRDSKSLTFMISSEAEGGVLTLWLPTEVIDAEDDFSVTADGAPITHSELAPTADARVLQINFGGGVEEIEVMGTSIVPEFGGLAILVGSIAAVGAVIAAKRFQKFDGGLAGRM